eukprot:XP_004918391.2 PREDICTED: olfactory receptor-like protein OLF4 [Xenopus tropicalis]
MENQTIVYILLLAGLSDLPSLQLPLFLLFLLIYLMTLTGNLLILLLIFTDSHLHTPMYFFLGTLACMDLCSSSVTAPKLLFDLLIQKRVISVRACITQIFFFLCLCGSEISVLAVMSYDRYIAICRPLHYMQIMSWKVCVHLVLVVFVLSAVHSLVHTLFLTKLTFCRPDVLQSFFCDLPQLLQVSCSDTFINVLLIFVVGIIFGLGILALTFFPYIAILRTILISSDNSWLSPLKSMIFANNSSVPTTFFNYYQSKANEQFNDNKVASVFYAILSPFLNPVIYSLRNQELKMAMKRVFTKIANFGYIG